MNNYADIINSLPRSVADLLQQEFDTTPINLNADPAYALELFNGAVARVKDEMVVDDDIRLMVLRTLDLVPEAAVQYLFFS